MPDELKAKVSVPPVSVEAKWSKKLADSKAKRAEMLLKAKKNSSLKVKAVLEEDPIKRMIREARRSGDHRMLRVLREMDR